MLVDKLGGSEDRYNKEQQNREVMPFGKYKGKPYSELSIWYIQTLLKKADWLDDYLRKKLKKALQNKKYEKACFGEFPTDKKYLPSKCKKCPFKNECADKANSYDYDEEIVIEEIDEELDL